MKKNNLHLKKALLIKVLLITLFAVISCKTDKKESTQEETKAKIVSNEPIEEIEYTDETMQMQQGKTPLAVLDIDENQAFFVTPNGKAGNDGTSWENALDLQTAINKAYRHSTKKFVLVAQGSYYADPNKIDISKSFELKDGVKIYGGFETNNLDIKKILTKQRKFGTSILEGNLGNGTNTQLIVKGKNLSSNTILDGFTIQNALNADDGFDSTENTDTDEEIDCININGAGFYLLDSSPTLANLSFDNNELIGACSSGGAIYNNNSNPSISNSNFTNNSADSGGAIYNNKSSPSISNVNFSNNSAKYDGGAIYNNKSSPSISNANFRDNSAQDYGGAIHNYKSNPNINNSNFANNRTNIGGAISNDYSNPIVINGSFSNNSASSGGAIYNNNSSPSVSTSSFNNNSATGENSEDGGGAIYNNENSSPNISKSKFNANFADDANGGAIYSSNNSSPNINNTNFGYNRANYGGAIYNDDNSNPIISKANFTENTADDDGGAIYNDKSTPSISIAIFAGNSADDDGGAICNWNKSNPTIDNVSFISNTGLSGGAIHNSNSNPVISNVSFRNNSAENNSGAIYNYNSNPSISNVSFINNFAENGGAIYNENSSPKIYNSILWNNKDAHKGKQAVNNIYNFEATSKPIIKNSILNVDSAVTRQGDDNKTNLPKTVVYNFMDFSKTEFKANQTPLAFYRDEQDKVIKTSKVLIKNKGDNALYKEVTKKEAGADKDLAGKKRLSGSKIDIGAYELQE